MLEVKKCEHRIMEYGKDVLTGTKTGSLHDGFGLFSLKTCVQLETIDVSVELFSSTSDVGVRVPFEEGVVTCS